MDNHEKRLNDSETGINKNIREEINLAIKKYDDKLDEKIEKQPILYQGPPGNREGATVVPMPAPAVLLPLGPQAWSKNPLVDHLTLQRKISRPLTFARSLRIFSP